MRVHQTTGRELKTIAATHLLSETFPASLEYICQVPARRAVNPLFSFFCDRNPLLRWRAVTAMGLVVSRLADENAESARVVMRRFMWNLNEESGGIGWGCPEAMGECLARSERLTAEYGGILLSYLHPERNFIDHPALQEGVLWGLGRMAHARPAAMADGAELLAPFLGSPQAALRGLAAWACGPLADARLIPPLEKLEKDTASFLFYRENRLEACPVGELAAQALRWTRTGTLER
jgi:HEAT repeat protein